MASKVVTKTRSYVVKLAAEKKFTTSYSGKEKRLFIHGADEKSIKNFIVGLQFKGLSQKTLGFDMLAVAKN